MGEVSSTINREFNHQKIEFFCWDKVDKQGVDDCMDYHNKAYNGNKWTYSETQYN